MSAYLTALTRLALVGHQDTDDDENDHDSDAAECCNDSEAELVRPRCTLVHQLTDHIRYVLTGLQLATDNTVHIISIVTRDVKASRPNYLASASAS